MLPKLICPATRSKQGVLGVRTTVGSGLIARVVVVYLSFLAVPLLAHHSVSMFDDTKEVVLDGSVRVMEWTHPHVWIRVNVLDSQGNVVEWGVETQNPLFLQRRGWSRTIFKTDDNVTITVHPAKDGRPFGDFVRATLADGTVIENPVGE